MTGSIDQDPTTEAEAGAQRFMERARQIQEEFDHAGLGDPREVEIERLAAQLKQVTRERDDAIRACHEYADRLSEEHLL